MTSPSTSEPQAISAELLARPIRGVNLRAATFGAELGDGPTVLAFLRHFG